MNTRNNNDRKKIVTRRIVIVDDHPLLRQGLRETIRGESGLGVCRETADARPAL